MWHNIWARRGFQVEEHIDLEMERLGRRFSEEVDESKPIFPGLVPQDPSDQMITSPSSQQNKEKAPWTPWIALTCSISVPTCIAYSKALLFHACLGSDAGKSIEQISSCLVSTFRLGWLTHTSRCGGLESDHQGCYFGGKVP